MHGRDGTKETHTWTLSNWLRVSGVRYQSCVMLYCVRRSVGMYMYIFSMEMAIDLLSVIMTRNKNFL